jgi:hypothetical protein
MDRSLYSGFEEVRAEPGRLGIKPPNEVVEIFGCRFRGSALCSAAVATAAMMAGVVLVMAAPMVTWLASAR